MCMAYISVSSSRVRPSDRPWEVEEFSNPADAERFADECYAGEHVRNFRRERELDQARLGDFFPHPKARAPRPRHRPRLSARQGDVLQAIASEIMRDLQLTLDLKPRRRSPQDITRHALGVTQVKTLGIPRALALLPGACISLWEAGLLRGLGVIIPTPVTCPGDVMACIGRLLGWQGYSLQTPARPNHTFVGDPESLKSRG